MKILTIVGARPQLIKAAALGRAIHKRSDIEEVLVHTGQHFDENMSDVFFQQLEMEPPRYNLSIHSLSHGAMTGRMLEEIEKLLVQEKPDWVLVYGDTNSTLAGALAARKMHISVAHVEAGLRSFNMRMPEEVNRILTDRISDALFCPTDTAVTNLKKEGVSSDIFVKNVGDVMLDVSQFFTNKLTPPSVSSPYVLCTLHRQENVDDLSRLSEIVKALNLLSEQINVVLPIHPRTRKMIESRGLKFRFSTIEPAGYMEMMSFLQFSQAVITDSGGLQKEAYFFKKPCITMRDETEWVELVESGVNFLVGASSDKILGTFERLKALKMDFNAPLYGSGNASELILDSLVSLSQK